MNLGRPATEDFPLRPFQEPYALTKTGGDRVVQRMIAEEHLPAVIVRPGTFFGPGDQLHFGRMADRVRTGKGVVVGSGRNALPFVYVTDVARAFYLAATTERVNEIYNLGAGNPQSVNRLVELLGGEVVHLPKRPGEPDCTWADISKIRRDLGWEPRVSFEQGVGMMLKNIEYWRQAPVWDRDSIELATKTWFRFLQGKT